MMADRSVRRRSTSAAARETEPPTDGHSSESGIRRAFEAFEEFAESRVLALPEDRSDRPPSIDPDTPLLRHKLTLTWQEIPAWQQDNEYILTGYRRIQHSYRGCATSLFGYLHNETVNVHSHLCGALLFCWILGVFQDHYFARYSTVTWIDRAVFDIFLGSAVVCLSFSALFHTCSAHSKEVASNFNALDYAGIVILIVGSYFPAVYYGFYCQPHFSIMYLSLAVVAGIIASYIVLNPEYRKPTHRGARTIVFCVLGLAGIFPVTHTLLAHGFTKASEEMGLLWLLASAVLYVNGALLYANRIPERLLPGAFDYFGASHQIFHFHVIFAALAHYRCVLNAFDHWHSRGAVCMFP